MKRIIEISTGKTGTIPTGKYMNEKPWFGIKETIEIDEEVADLQDDYTKVRLKELQKICDDLFDRQAQISFQQRIAEEYKQIRFYDAKEGLKYPSVTSITGMDKDFNMPPDELAQYGCRGTLLHKQAEIFLLTGEKKEPKDIEECSSDYLTVVKGNLGLLLDDVDFCAFYKDYPFKVIECEKVTINDEHKYGGRIDIIAVIESKNKGKWAKIPVDFDTPIILDIKTSTELDKMGGLTQQAAYAKSEGIKQIGLIHITNKNKCGFATPVTANSIDRYWNLFENKRAKFKERYGV